MIIDALSEAECRELLVRSNIGRLACAHDGQPYIVPISFYFDGTAHLYSFSTAGQKIHWMRRNPKVCVEVDDITDRFHWSSVIVMGIYEELGDAAGEELRRALGLLQQHAHWWLPGAAAVANHDPQSSVVIFRIRISTVTGRRTGRSTP